MTLKGTALRLGISVKEVQELIASGELKAVNTNVGGFRQTVVLSDSVEAYKALHPNYSWPKMTKKKGDDKRLLILETYRCYGRNLGRPPTIRELMDVTGLKSTSSVWAHLKTLERSKQLKNLGGQRGYALNTGIAGWACVGRWGCGPKE